MGGTCSRDGQELIPPGDVYPPWLEALCPYASMHVLKFSTNSSMEQSMTTTSINMVNESNSTLLWGESSYETSHVVTTSVVSTGACRFPLYEHLYSQRYQVCGVGGGTAVGKQHRYDIRQNKGNGTSGGQRSIHKATKCPSCPHVHSTCLFDPRFDIMMSRACEALIEHQRKTPLAYNPAISTDNVLAALEGDASHDETPTPSSSTLDVGRAGKSILIRFPHAFLGEHLVALFIDPSNATSTERTFFMYTVCLQDIPPESLAVIPRGYEFFCCPTCRYILQSGLSEWIPFSEYVLRMFDRGNRGRLPPPLTFLTSTECPSCTHRRTCNFGNSGDTSDQHTNNTPTLTDVIICDGDAVNATILREQCRYANKNNVRFGTPGQVIRYLREGASCRFLLVGSAINDDLLEFVARVRSVAPEVTTCVFGVDCPALRDACMSVGADMYIVRPITLKEFQDLMAELQKIHKDKKMKNYSVISLVVS
eukprot:PhF_6_TR13224/c0_g1_i1/m.20913